MSDKRQRTIAKRLKRKPTREFQKARARREHNRQKSFDDCSDLVTPLALAILATKRRPR